jgi:transketolase
MINYYQIRTIKHINRVKKWANKIVQQHPELKDLLIQIQTHDQSKFEQPELDPYIWLTWKYKCQDENVEFNIPERIKKLIKNAVTHHLQSNKHHPEYFASDPTEKPVNAEHMDDISIAEMIADWFAMSEEKKNNPKEWADKNIGTRWNFTDHQKKLIYKLIDTVWK